MMAQRRHALLCTFPIARGCCLLSSLMGHCNAYLKLKGMKHNAITLGLMASKQTNGGTDAVAEAPPKSKRLERAEAVALSYIVNT